MECGKTFLYLQKQIGSSFLFAFVPSRCKSWSCEKCRPIKANVVKNYVRNNFTGRNLYFLTLTYFHSGNALDAWHKLGRSWNLMRTYITKKYGKFSYIRIVEPHKKGGWPHLHILIDGCVVDSSILKKVTEWGFGWNAQVQRITASSAAFYVSKYLSKKWPDTQADIMRIASKSRIVSTSRDLPAIFTKESEWDCVKYAVPAGYAKFMCNALIQLLRHKKCGYVLSRPFSDGFIIESDTDIKRDWLESYFDPYVWEYSEDFNYSFAPYGLQEILNL